MILIHTNGHCLDLGLKIYLHSCTVILSVTMQKIHSLELLTLHSFVLFLMLRSNVYLFTLSDQLFISVTPTNVEIGERGTAGFTATASGIRRGNFLYQWRKEGSSSLPNKASGINGAVLTIPNLSESDEGKYYCTVTNEWGNSKRSGDVTLSVIGKYCNH